jgi:formate dehydrogenase subunit gamma
MMHDENDNCNKLFICRAARCKKNGSDNLVELLEKVLKTEIDKDDAGQLIKLESTYCLGQCSYGPNIKANNKIYTHVDNQLLKRVLVVMKTRLMSKGNS